MISLRNIDDFNGDYVQEDDTVSTHNISTIYKHAMSTNSSDKRRSHNIDFDYGYVDEDDIASSDNQSTISINAFSTDSLLDSSLSVSLGHDDGQCWTSSDGGSLVIHGTLGAAEPEVESARNRLLLDRFAH